MAKTFSRRLTATLVSSLFASHLFALELVESDWIDEDVNTFAGRREGSGTWTAAPGRIAACGERLEISSNAAEGDFVTFTDRIPSSGNKVEIESEMTLTSGVTDFPSLPPGVQFALTATVENDLWVYSADGWTPVDTVLDHSQPDRLYKVLFSVDYTAGTFSLRIDGVTAVTADGQRVFRLAGRPTRAQTAGFGGGIGVKALQGGCRTASPSSVSAAEVHAAFAALPDHPRLNVRGPAGLAALVADPSPEARFLRSRVTDAAESALHTPTVVSSKVGKRLSGDDDAVAIILVSAAGYALTGDVRYAARARDEMLSVCAWPDWVPTHYLGTANLLRGLAFGYDWTYATLTESERQAIRTAIIDRGFKDMTGWQAWDTSTVNWSQVCWQGVLAAALAIYEDDVSETEALVLRAIPALARSSTAIYSPNGAYPEGPGYWSYGTGRLCILLDQLEKALGTTFGLYELTGVGNTGEFPLATEGPTGYSFNYSDCSASKTIYRTPELYLAAKADRPDWTTAERTRLAADLAGATRITGVNALQSLLWTSFPMEASDSRIPLDYYGRGSNPIAVLRDGFAFHGLFLGIKGGRASLSHGHMDVGSFIFEMDGQRWASDLGVQDYTGLEALGTIDLWNMTQDSTRWNVFRLNQMSHNLVTLDGERLKVNSTAEITCVQTGDVSIASLDLTDTYGRTLVSSAVRRFELDRVNRRLTVTDAFAGVASGTAVRWAMVTPALVETVSGDTLRLRQGGSRLDLTMTSSVPGGAWTVTDLTQPTNSWDAPNPGYVQLCYTVPAPDTRAVNLSAEFRSAFISWPKGTTFYGLNVGKASTGADVGTGSAYDTIGWWTGPNASTATQENVPSPWTGASYGYRFVLLGSQKLTRASSFPETPLSIGTPETAANLRFDGGISINVPQATVHRATFNANSNGQTDLSGSWNFVRPGETTTLLATAIEHAPRGLNLHGSYTAESNVTLTFRSTFATKATAAGIHRLSGDFSHFRGMIRSDKSTYSEDHDPYVSHQLLELTSPTALGDPTAPRNDAFVLADNTWLLFSEAVDQSVPRGIRFELATNEKGYLTGGDADWTLTATVVATNGTLIKPDQGRLTLAGRLETPMLVVTNGTLVVSPSADLAVPQMTFCSGSIRDNDRPLLTFADDGVTLESSLLFTLFGTNGESCCVIRAPEGSTNRLTGSVRIGSLTTLETTNRVGALVTDAGSRLEFDGTFHADTLPLNVSGSGSVRFGGNFESHSSFSAYGCNVEFVRPGNTFCGFRIHGGCVTVAAENALKILPERAGHQVLIDGDLEICSTTQRLWGLNGTGTVHGVENSVAAPAGVPDGEVVSCGVRFTGDVSLVPADGNWRFTAASTSLGELIVTNGSICLSGCGSWAGTNVTVCGRGILELGSPKALSDVYGHLAVEGPGQISVPKGVAARVAFLSVGGQARMPGTYGSAAACALCPGATTEAALTGDGVLVVTGGNPSVQPPYCVTGILDVRGDRTLDSLMRTVFHRISVTGGSLTLNLAPATAVRTTTLEIGTGGSLALAADVTVEAATVLANGIPLAAGTYRAGDVPWLTGAGTLTVLITSFSLDIRAARVLRSLRKAGSDGTWYASWLRPWSYTGFALPDGVNYRPANPVTVDLESTSAGYMKAGVHPLLCFYDFNEIAGAWEGAQYYAKHRAGLTALVKAIYKRWGTIVAFSWHPENPYVPTGFCDPTYGAAPCRYRFGSPGYPVEHRYVIREILENTGEPCGLGRSPSAAETDGLAAAATNPREWFDARLDEIASFIKGLRDEQGRPIPVIARLFPACEDNGQCFKGSHLGATV